MYLLKNLDYLMRVNRLSRARLARELDIAPSTINTWFSKGCENISLRFLIKISDYFKITIDDLVNTDLEAGKSDKEIQLMQSIGRILRIMKEGDDN